MLNRDLVLTEKRVEQPLYNLPNYTCMHQVRKDCETNLV